MKKSSSKSGLQKFTKQTLTKKQKSNLKGGNCNGDQGNQGIVTEDLIIE